MREADEHANSGGGTMETLKVLIAGLLALSISTLAASVLLQLNTGRLLPIFFLVVSCVLTVFTCCFTWAALLHAFGCGPHGAVVVLGLTLPLGSWFLIHANHEYWLLGPGVAGVSAAEAGRHRYASSFRLSDVRVATEFMGVKGVSYGGGRGHQPRTRWYYVAPVVPEGWAPGQSVPLWAAAPANQYYGSLEDWSKPYRPGASSRPTSCDTSAKRRQIPKSGTGPGCRTAPSSSGGRLSRRLRLTVPENSSCGS